MKLLNKTFLYLILISLPLLIAVCIFSYYTVRGELLENTDELLEKDKLSAENLVMKGLSKDVTYLAIDSLSTIRYYPSSVVTPFFKDTMIYNSYEEEVEKYRMLRSSHSADGKLYLITVVKPTIEEEDLLESLTTSFAVMLILLVILFSFISWLLSRSLWKPFYRMLEQLRNFDLRKNAHISYQSSSVKEFRQLNEVLEKMSLKIYSDYLHQKEFTENSAHEMQTPLAVIKAHIGLLMQSPNLKAEEMEQLQAIENTVKKLTSLNKALLLLAKIENNQFSENTSVTIGEVIRKIVAELEVFASVKRLDFSVFSDAYLVVQMNPVLAEVLLTNLIQNAIRHAPEGGTVGIELKNKTLVVRNSGMPLSVKPEELFLRFKKNESAAESIGLGLAIVKSITDLYGMELEYAYSEDQHWFIVVFPDQPGTN